MAKLNGTMHQLGAPFADVADDDWSNDVASVESETPASGLDRSSRAVANQLRTVARHRVIYRIGHLEAAELEALDRALLIQLGLPL